MEEIPIETRLAGPEELRLLVTELLPGIDRHERGKPDFRVWTLAAKSGQWTCAQLAAGVMELIPTFSGYAVKVADLQQIIDAQALRIRQRWYCPDPPRHLAEDPAAEAEWMRNAARDFRERALYALAAGHPIEDVAMVRDVEPDPPELPERRDRMEQIANELARGKAIPAVPEPIDMPAHRPPADPVKVANARAELDAVRPAAS